MELCLCMHMVLRGFARHGIEFDANICLSRPASNRLVKTTKRFPNSTQLSILCCRLPFLVLLFTAVLDFAKKNDCPLKKIPRRRTDSGTFFPVANLLPHEVLPPSEESYGICEGEGEGDVIIVAVADLTF